MKTIFASLMLALLLTGSAIGQQVFQGGRALVEGTIITQSGQGIPGLGVSIWSPQTGRGTPAYTNQVGYFFFTNVPIGTGYYIEVYWGNTLLGRDQFIVNTDHVMLPPVTFAIP